MTDNTQPEALRLAGFLDKLDVRTVDRIQNCVSAAAELRRLHAYAAELESQVIADCMAGGAGGVSGPLMGRASLAASAGSEPVAWTGGEEWEQLAWHLCAEENGEDACDEVIWEGGPIPEPWGARWMKYESDAKRMIELVRRFYTHPSPPEGAGWKWVPKILSAEMVDAWASARLPGGIAQMTDDEANRAVAQANWDSMIAAAPPATSAGSGKGE